jgi:hypothetical protein
MSIYSLRVQHFRRHGYSFGRPLDVPANSNVTFLETVNGFDAPSQRILRAAENCDGQDGRRLNFPEAARPPFVRKPVAGRDASTARKPNLEQDTE